MSAIARRQTLLWQVALVLLVAGLLIHGIPIIADALRERPWDGQVNLAVARGWWQGIDPYTPAALKAVELPSIGHPPTTGFWLLALAAVPKAQLSWTMAFLLLSALFAQTYWMGQELELPSPLTIAALLVAWSVNTTWMRYHLYLAQISELICFLWVLGWLALRRRWDVLGGMALGAACTIKLFPGLLVFYLLLEKRWRVVVAAAATWLAIAGLMVSRIGVATFREFAEQEPEIFRFWIAHPHNATLQSMLQRWLFAPFCGRTMSYNPASSAISAVVVLALFAGIVWLTRRRDRDVVLFDLGYWTVGPLAVVGNPFAFEHYVVLYLPTAIIVGWQVHQLYLRRPLLGRDLLLAGTGAAVVIACLIMLSTSMYAQDTARNAWIAGKHGHWKVHALEACFWLPPWLLGIACMLFARRRAAQ